MNFVQVVSVLALASYLGLIVLVGRNARREEPRAFMLFLLAMVVWQASVTLVTLSNNYEVALLGYRLALGLGSSFGLFYARFVRKMLGITSHSWVMTIGYVIAAATAIVTLMGSPLIVPALYSDPRTPMLLPEFGILTYPMGLYLYGYLAYGLWNLLRYYRTTTSELLRTRLRYLMLGVSLVFAGSMINYSEYLKVYPIDVIANLANAVLIAYAILRYRLLDISVVVRKGLLYSVPAVIISAAYLFSVYLAVTVFHAVTGYQVLVLSFLVAILTATAFQPLWVRLQSRLDRLFFREKYDASLMVERLSRTAASMLDLNLLAGTILQELTAVMHISQAALLLKDEASGEFTVAVAMGLDDPVEVRLGAGNPIAEWLSRHAGVLSSHDIDVMPQFRSLWTQERTELQELGAELFAPLTAKGELVGILVLGPKLSEAPYSEEEQVMLLTLGNQTAMAVQNARLYHTAVEEKERTEVIVRQAFAGIMVVDGDRRVLTLNPGAESITGYSAGELLGEVLPPLFDPSLWAEQGPLARAAAQRTPMAPMETTLNGKQGTRDVLLGVTPISDGYLLNFADITRLKEVDRLKSNIVANVSHELRTPLASIKGYTELLMDGYESHDEVMRQQFLAVISEESDRLATYINDLLDLARLESGRVEPHLEEVDIEEVIYRAVRLLDIQARQANVGVWVDAAEDLPLLNGSRDLLESVLKNLVGNAIKFSPSGGRVEVIARQANGNLVLKVIDHGIGISAEELPHLFSKFYRSGGAREARIRGTGLGLVLAKEAVLAHHGDIGVESSVGGGTRFTVTLPVGRGGG